MSVSVSQLLLRDTHAYLRCPALARGEKVIADYATFATRVAATSIARHRIGCSTPKAAR